MTPLFWTAIQAAGLIELPCATPSKGAEASGGVGVSGIAVGVVELLSAIDVGMEFYGRWRRKIFGPRETQE